MPVNIAGNFDRSPCGTGTSARLAVLHAAGALDVGRTYVNSGVLGTTYEARILSTTVIGATTAVIPEITGSAWVTGRAERWAETSDPLAEGFFL
jgi:proline racemase